MNPAVKSYQPVCLMVITQLNLAFNNAREQTGQENPTLIHIPTHGTIPGGIEVIWNKYFATKAPTGNARQAGEILDIINDNNYGQNIASHSGGGTIVAPWLAQQPQGSLEGSQIGFSGVPLGRNYLKDIGLKTTGQDSTVNIKAGDFVGDIMGRNANTPIRVIEGIGGFFLLPTPMSQHSHYPCSVCKPDSYIDIINK